MIRILFIPHCIAVNLLYKLSHRLNEETKTWMIRAAAMGISLIGVLRYFNDDLKEFISYDSGAVRMISTLLLLMLVTASIDKKADIRRLHPDKLFWAGWFVCFFIMLAAAFVNPVRKDYFLWSILSLTLFPMMMIVWTRHDDIQKVIRIIARCMVAMSFVFILMNFVIMMFTVPPQPFDDYTGMFGNPNNNGLICTAFYTSALFLLITDRTDEFAYMFSLCICIVFSVISVCHTAQLCMLIEALTAVYVCKKGSYFKWEVSAKGVKLFIAAAAISIAAGCMLVSMEKKDINAYAITDYEEAVEWVCSEDTRMKLNVLSSGRLLIWRAYSRNLSAFGKGSPDGPLMPEEEASTWAHNNALDIGYISGVIAMTGYLIWLAVGWIFLIGYLIRPDLMRREYLFTILAFTGYFIHAMLEITIYPMITGVAFLAFISLGPVAFREHQTAKKK
ncbi:MAG: hypothetical protein IKE74_04615 [Mogibacterium sp.]|nr:hypothetical protein [Mogibacterium sp.]